MYHEIETHLALRPTKQPKRFLGLLKRVGNITPQVKVVNVEQNENS